MVVQALLGDLKRDESFREEKYLRAIKRSVFRIRENDGFFFFEILELIKLQIINFFQLLLNYNINLWIGNINLEI